MPHAPKITMDVFDMPIGMARRQDDYEDVINPRRMGQKAVKKFGADMVTVHLISTDHY